jgi:hypothetical protein
MFELKTRFESWITRKVVNGASLFHLSYIKTLMTYPCSQRTSIVQINCFMFNWPIYRLFVLNTVWILDSIQMIIFVSVSLTLSLVELKTRFETWLTRNDVNAVSLFHLSYLTTLMVYLCPQRTPNVQIMCFMFDWSIYRLFVLNTGWKRDCLQIIIFVYVCYTWGMFELKTRFESCITRIDVNGLSLIHRSYLTTLMAYQCSQRTPNVQIMYFMFHWSIYRIFVLNTGWKRDSLQMMIIVCLFDM